MMASELINRLQEYVKDHGDHPVEGSVAEHAVADICMIDTDGEFTDFEAKPDSQVKVFWLIS